MRLALSAGQAGSGCQAARSRDCGALLCSDDSPPALIIKASLLVERSRLDCAMTSPIEKLKKYNL